ncbi:Rieske (2Fe-2S) protein [Xanthobacter agilis]|jgi:nitrite reductase/ring-hydroxylating ferredoxin subunit|uniref:Nitrite reductase/ring-hydroxylating ferredoxin subunit n=1 Tax=Xanthobacter agilis TaxID=47492 RepID=A0ABU0LDM8_XANAG|nr:Rieske 2Fe-2S domain-containing protein [Xanthobacter agilis]MDQ0505252.1 nitrite reductase/ring-hydroxylating ferredoxin subunit [Xanthobacter agilis]
MSAEDIEVYAICEVDDIDPGEAKAFNLSRVGEDGAARPFRILVVRTGAREVVGYVNACPHQGTWLNVGSGEFFNKDGTLLRCGRHGALFDIESGACTEGPCKDQSLEPIALAVVGDDVCLCGVTLVEEEDRPFPYDELDDTMEIMISPD